MKKDFRYLDVNSTTLYDSPLTYDPSHSVMERMPLFHRRTQAPVMISRSQEQSVDEDSVILPLTESSPELVHCEAERRALEQLLRTGPGAFYARLKEGHLQPFLSPEEVRQVSSWAEDYHSSQAFQEDGSGEANSGGEAMQPLSVQYFPVHSDTPTPDLELGWPEKHVWERTDQAMVYTNPPVDRAPHIREVVRKLLQGANTLIAIVTDRLTDSMVIKDLQYAALRGVPVYIILNRRSAQENFITNRLRHPNIRVRVAGGKVFLSRGGRMVVGELKENFILVDLETVVLGSYSLTWTDVHLHRQLITVLRGPTLQAFDQEFRILYAASMPVPDVWKPDDPTGMPQLEENHTLYPLEHVEPKNHIPVLLQCPPSPPPPPTGSPIDWDTLGVTKWKHEVSEDPELCEELHVFHRTETDRQVDVAVATGELGTLGWGKGFTSVTAEHRHMADYDTTTRNMVKPERALFRTMTEWENRNPTFRSRDFQLGMKKREEFGLFSRIALPDNQLRVDTGLRDNTMAEDGLLWSATATTNHQTLDDFSDILTRTGSHRSSSTPRLGEFTTSFSKSLLDLSDHIEDLPQTSKLTCADQFPLTPAVALIKKRNDNIKAGLMRSPRAIIPRSFSFALHREPGRSPLFRAQKSEDDK